MQPGNTWRWRGGPEPSSSPSAFHQPLEMEKSQVRKRTFVKLLGAAVLPTMTSLTHSQDRWPVRPIKIVVPVTPGGTADVIAREFGRRLGERVGQPVVVENRPGANGIPATVAVARAPADGYTLML